MNKIVLSLFILTNLTVKAQFILAGQHGPNDYYYDITPDTTVVAFGEGTDGYSFDINNDGIIDFDLIAFSISEPLFEYSTCNVDADSSNQLAMGYIDSCAYELSIGEPSKMAYVFNKNDTINYMSNWTHASQVMAYYNDHYQIGSCSYNAFNFSGSQYLGVRVFSSTDTLYGWIKVSGISSTSFTVQEYACNLGITGINEHQNNSSIKLYPNPAINQITIHTSSFHNEAATVSVINMLGEIVQEEKLKWSNDININIKNLCAGIYFLQLKSESGSVVRKFVKQ